MRFFLSLLVDGALAGAVYALVALAFVIVYKTSRMINFALGEWAMVGSRLVATGLHPLGLGLPLAVGGACAVMVGAALGFNRLVVRRLVGRPVIALIMVTLGLGTLMRGAAAVLFQDVPGSIPLPIPTETLEVYGVPVATDRLVAAVLAAACVAAVSWFFRRTRTGVAMRAIADDPQAASSAGIDVDHHLSITWAMVAVIATIAGVLWAFVSGGTFGVVLVGLKIFPIVILGGLDSVPGTVVGAVVIGILESLAAGYIDPHLGGGFSHIASYLVLIAMLFVRPYGLFGRPAIERV